MSWYSRTEVDALRRDLQRERERADAAQGELAQLRAGLAAVPTGLVFADAGGAVFYRNPSAAVGGHGEVLVEEALERLLDAAVRGVAGERRLDLFGPPPRVLHIRAIPLDSAGALAVIDDISERARLDAVRTDFVANISHELKTPVGALAVLAEALAGSDDLQTNAQLAERMVDEALRAASTIDDLLELSRIELGGQGERELVSLAAVFGEVGARHRLPAENARVHLEFAPTNGLAVLADRLQLVSAVSNLVDNAIKYSHPGGRVAVAAVPTGGWLEISVTDTGVGIPARDLDRVFERFYRVDRARSRETGGTGLGLAIVRHIAANHGGDVSVHSREGEGSTFTLRVPLEETV